MRNANAFLLGGLIWCSSLGANASRSIVGGTAVLAGSEISLAMAYLDLGTGYCSGVFISPRHILTAGHCIEHITSIAKVRVEIGSERAKGPSVASFVRHPGYEMQKDGRIKDDFGVLILAQPVSGVVPALISSAKMKTGSVLLAAGYGFSNARKTKRGALLSSPFVFGRTAKIGGDRYADGSYNLVLTGAQMVCQGDSGGATFDHAGGRLRVVGIHSMADCENLGLDAVATEFTGWIKAQLTR